MDKRYIYLLRRTRKNRAVVIDYRKVWNATKVERRLHQIFNNQRFQMRKTKSPPWIGYHVKIGIATDVEKRLNQINKSGLRSGATEWFYFTPGDVFYTCFLLIYFQLLPFIRLSIILFITFYLILNF